MLTKEQFFEWMDKEHRFSDIDYIYSLYVLAAKYEVLIEFGVDNWSGFLDALQSLNYERNSNN